MNSRLASLQPYPFERLAKLIEGVTPPKDKPPIRLSIGEPQHAAPAFVLEALAQNLAGLSHYPVTKGSIELRRALASWINRRYALGAAPLDPERNVIPVAGTREALFSIAQAVVDRRTHAGPVAQPIIVSPNPFYQIYEGAALLAGAAPVFLNTVEANGYRMEFESVPREVWQRTQLVYLCSPANPTGKVMSRDDFEEIIVLSQQYGFVIASDECYSELYFDEAHPPHGLLGAACELGIEDYRNCLVFNSLSKRSNLPGLRSGFVAGDAELLERYVQYRTYQGCALPPPTQAASIAAWNDEAHVRANRDQYRAKFEAVLPVLTPVLDVKPPQAGFFLWAGTPLDDESFTRELYARENVLVLPGSYLSREAGGINPGANRVRMALVASVEECLQAAQRIRNYVESL